MAFTFKILLLRLNQYQDTQLKSTSLPKNHHSLQTRLGYLLDQFVSQTALITCGSTPPEKAQTEKEAS